MAAPARKKRPGRTMFAVADPVLEPAAGLLALVIAHPADPAGGAGREREEAGAPPPSDVEMGRPRRLRLRPI